MNYVIDFINRNVAKTFYSILMGAFFSCSSYSIHEANLIQQNKVMLKHDKQSKHKQQRMRSDKQVKKKYVKSRIRRII